MTPALAAVLAYLALQLSVGIWVARRIASESDYLVAGRRLGYGLATFSIFATWFGAETTIGSAGTAYVEGAGAGSAEPFGYGLCLLLMGLVFAGPLRRRGLVTLADLYRQRYSTRVERRLPRSAFEPRPSVDAGVLVLQRRAQPLVPDDLAGSYRAYVAAGFRRGLGAVATMRARRRLGVAAAAPRELDPHQWATLFLDER